MLSPRDLLNMGIDPKPPVSLTTATGPAAPHPVSHTEQERGAVDKALAEYVAMLKRGGNGHGGEFDSTQMAGAVSQGNALEQRQAAIAREEAANLAMLAAKARASTPPDATAVRTPTGRD